jgi:hypothetical protein
MSAQSKFDLISQRDRSLVPRALRASLNVMLIVAAALSVPRIGGYGPLPTTTLLDAWVILFVFSCLLRGRIDRILLVLLLVGYLLTRLIPALVTEAPLEDFLQAYRWVLYLIAFAMGIGQDWGPVRPLIKVMWALLILALVKASVTFAVLGPGERPGLLLENNFELALFAGLVGVVYRHLGSRQVHAVVLLGLITVLSGSRSGAIAFLLLALYAVTQAKSTSLLSKYLLACLVPLLVALPIWVFSQRAANATQVDRLNFLDVFINETHGWNALIWLFGTPPITPLGDGCLRLSYYQMLFSSVGDGSCYSVILHAFLLRVVFDAGIVGLLIAFGVAWYAMRLSGVKFGLTMCLLLIAFTNGLSVSGLNNPYVALPILLAILTVKSESGEGRWSHPKRLLIARQSELTSKSLAQPYLKYERPRARPIAGLR